MSIETEKKSKLEFTPPTAEQVRGLFTENRPTQDSLWMVRLPLFIGLGAVGILLLVDNAVITMMLWLAFISVFIAAMMRVRYLKQLEAQGVQVDEWAMQRRYVDALRSAWVLLPKSRKRHGLYMRMSNVIAHCLSELKCHEASAEAYDFLIDHLPLEGAGVKQLRVYRAISWLMEDRLADADDTLRHLRGVKSEFKGTALASAYTYAELLQCVKTYHFDEGVALSETLLNDMRPLGIEAGYTYAMMSTCYHEMVLRTEDEKEKARLEKEANKWWEYATCLIKEEHLMNRMPPEVMKQRS
ncbi:hypothetical protein JD969_06330 [Planctomycetota bacterium]|nr:hypothetical protein JD969_06330 [Planctomycetota bacterium]